MTDPKYLINISYNPAHVNGQQEVSIGPGITASMPTYATASFVATMPEVKISATGSTYEEALDNLLIVAATVPQPVNPPLNNTRTW